jgi:hypothetical protein
VRQKNPMADRTKYNNEIPSHIGFIVLLVFGLITAFVTIRMGDKIIQDVPDSKALNANKQLQQEINNTK